MTYHPDPAEHERVRAKVRQLVGPSCTCEPDFGLYLADGEPELRLIHDPDCVLALEFAFGQPAAFKKDR